MKNLLLAIFLLLASSCVTNPKMTQENAQPTPQKALPLVAPIEEQSLDWKMVSIWPAELDILTQGIKRFIEDVQKISNNRLNITLVDKKLNVFEAVSKGEVQLGHSVSYLWINKIPAAQFMASVPFGMDAKQHLAWLKNGEGLNLWKKYYRSHNIIPFPMGNTGMQMGGWFNKRIHSISDFKGLKIRLPGIAGEVLVQIGAIPTQMDNLVQALENGTIDAVEWMGPYYDKKKGLHKAAKYYYYPGWHEPSTTLELLINREAWEKLPNDLQEIIKIVATNTHHWIYREFESKNAQALQTLKSTTGLKVIKFPQPVLKILRQTTLKVLEQKAKADSGFNEVYLNYKSFQKTLDSWRTKAQQ